MIIREWRGRASEPKADAYPKHFREAVVPELRKLPGFLGAHLSRRRMGDRIEFLVLTRWQSMGAIRAFAGANVERAVVEPGAIAARRVRPRRAALRGDRGGVRGLTEPARSRAWRARLRGADHGHGPGCCTSCLSGWAPAPHRVDLHAPPHPRPARRRRDSHGRMGPARGRTDSHGRMDPGKVD